MNEESMEEQDNQLDREQTAVLNYLKSIDSTKRSAILRHLSEEDLADASTAAAELNREGGFLQPSAEMIKALKDSRF